MTQRRFAIILTFLVTMFSAGYAVGGPAWFVPGGGGGASVSPSGTAAAGEVTFWTSPTAISGNTLWTYNSGTGVVSMNTNGTAGAPVLTMGSPADANTGIFHPAADALAISTSGTERLRAIATGEIGIGCSDPITILETSGTGITQYYNSTFTNTAALYTIIQTARARGTRASPTAVQNGDELGEIGIGGQYNTSLGGTNEVLKIHATAAENFDGTHNGSTVVIQTSSLGTAVPANRIKIDSAGDITSGNAAHTSDFLPFADNTGQLGTLAQRWSLIAGVTVHSGDLHLQDDARGAHWILREEPDGISLVNVITGKRFRMAMVPEEEERAESLWHHACRAVGVCQ